MARRSSVESAPARPSSGPWLALSSSTPARLRVGRSARTGRGPAGGGASAALGAAAHARRARRSPRRAGRGRRRAASRAPPARRRSAPRRAAGRRRRATAPGACRSRRRRAAAARGRRPKPRRSAGTSSFTSSWSASAFVTKPNTSSSFALPFAGAPRMRTRWPDLRAVARAQRERAHAARREIEREDQEVVAQLAAGAGEGPCPARRAGGSPRSTRCLPAASSKRHLARQHQIARARRRARW